MQIIRHMNFNNPALTGSTRTTVGQRRVSYTPWCALKIGGISKEKLVSKIRHRYTVMSSMTPNRLEELEFDTFRKKRDVLLGVFTTRDLGLSDDCTLAEVHDENYLAKWSEEHLNEFGLRAVLCPPETGLHLRLQYTQPPDECLVMAMKLLNGYMLSVETFQDGKPYLDISPIEADHGWNKYYFVFALENLD